MLSTSDSISSFPGGTFYILNNLNMERYVFVGNNPEYESTIKYGGTVFQPEKKLFYVDLALTLLRKRSSFFSSEDTVMVNMYHGHFMQKLFEILASLREYKYVFFS